MLRKVSHILFTSYYLLLSLGLTVSAHYCLGAVSSVSILVAASPCACGADEPMPCCNTETVSVSLEDEQAFSKTLAIDYLPWISVPLAVQPDNYYEILPASEASRYDNTGPPLVSGKNIRLRIHSLILYA